MNKKQLRLILILLALAVALYTGWSSRDAAAPEASVDLPTATTEAVQPDTQPEELPVILPAEDETDPPESETTAPEETAPVETEPEETQPQQTESAVTEDGEYTSKEEVAEYIHLFGHLPGNFITKKEAQALGWVSSKGNLWEVAPGKSIGGDRFGNYEGQLPKAGGRTYTECDIDFDGGFRDARRIIFSNDGLIYYTDDHYETFTLLYGEA